MMTIDVIEATTFRTHCMTAKLVKARKSHACAYSRDVSWGRGCRTIRPGDVYVRVTMFPGHDFGDQTVPESSACCIVCAEGYIGLDNLAAGVGAVQP